MKYQVMLFLVFLFPVYTVAQQGGCACSSEEEYQQALLNGLIGVEYTNPVAGYEGEQYLRDWAYGGIRLRTGEVISNAIIKYDRYLDQLLWLRTRDYRKGVLNKSDITQFRIYQDGAYPEALFVKKKIRLPYLDSTEVFVHELVQGRIELFAYRNVKVEPVANKLYDDTKHVISTKEHDYLIRLRRKNLLELPFINKTEMKKLLRHNHITLRDNERGMAMAIRFYSQLEL
ncbi:MAG TPA: hypothetical protein VHI78_13660 [Bacteroidales bacterium]|nr:hypothetical protein [Bacteroidales bacterium]